MPVLAVGQTARGESVADDVLCNIFANFCVGE